MLEHAAKILQVLILSAFAICIAATAPADDGPSGSLPAAATKVAAVEGITEYRLDNGFRFLLYPDASYQQTIVGITYLVGSRHEGYGEAGMAHLLEHLLFEGTPTHPNILNELTAHGGSYDATTEHDGTHYIEAFPADEDNLARTLDLEADRMVNSFINAEDLASVLTVIRNERELRENNPWMILLERVLSTAFLWHNYGNLPIGYGADVESVPIERLRAFYRKYYQPDNAVLVIAGRFDPERAVALVEEKFGRIPPPERRGANRLYGTYTVEPTQDGERTVTLRRVGNVQYAIAAYHVPSVSHEQYAAVNVLEHLLGQPAGRLYKNMVETGLAANTLVEAYPLKEPGMLIAGAEVRREGNVNEAVKAMLATLEGIADDPPTPGEVERAKTELAAGFEIMLKDPALVVRILGESAAFGDWRLTFLHRDRLTEVTPADVLAVAKTYLMTSNRTVGYFLPTDVTPPRAEIPPPPDVAALVSEYEGGEAVAQGEAFEPTTGNIESRTTRLTLANGVKVALLPKESRGDAVILSFRFPHGSEDALMGQRVAADFAGHLLLRGTMRRSRQELREEFVRLKAEAELNGDVFSVGGWVTTVRENLPDVLRLVAEVLREPAFDPAEFELLRQAFLASAEERQFVIQARIDNAIKRHLTGQFTEEHPFYQAPFAEMIDRGKAVTVSQARDFWASFYGAEGGAVSIVGDFDADEIVPVLEEVLDGWTANEAYTRVGQRYADAAAINVDIEMPDNANAMMAVYLNVRMRDDHPDYPALLLANYLLNAQLRQRIRGQEGLSYDVGSAFSADPNHENAIFLARAMFAPQNAGRVASAFREEIDGVLKWGFAGEFVEEAKRSYLNNAQRRRSDDREIASLLELNLLHDRTMAFIAQQEAAIEALTADDLLTAMRRHIDPERMSIFRAGDFANNPAR